MEKSSTEYMIEFQRKYPIAGSDPLLRDLCIKIREEGIKEGANSKNPIENAENIDIHIS